MLSGFIEMTLPSNILNMDYLPYIEWIDTQKKPMAAMLAQWVNTNSGSDNMTGLAQQAAALKSAFSVLEPEIREIALKPAARISDGGETVEEPVGKALVMTKHPDALVQVLLLGHMDTVFPENSPFQKAEMLDEKTMRGPGAADMKGGIMVMLKALEALERSPFAGKVGWEVILNPDEELGSPSSEPLIVEAASQKAFCLVFEPSFNDGSIVNKRKGSWNFTVAAKGKAAHAGRDFEKGSNAIVSLSRFILEAEKLTDLSRGITLNFGRVHGGQAANIVADMAVCRCNARVVAGKELARLKTKLHTIIERLNKENSGTLSLFEETERAPKLFDAPHKKLFSHFEACAEELGFTLKFKASGGVCDGNITAKEGLPTIDTLGPVGGNIHTFDEYANLESMGEHAKLTALFLFKLATGEIERENGTDLG